MFHFWQNKISMKKIILIVVGLIIVAVAGRVMWAYWQVKNDEAMVANTDVLQSVISKNVIDKNGIELSMNIPQETKVAENFQGSYLFRYGGYPFDGIILLTESREGISNKKYEIRSGDTSSSVSLDNPDKVADRVIQIKAFELNSQGVYRSSMDSFSEAGIYTYSISVYDCVTIEKTLGKNNCKFSLEDAESGKIDNIEPLKSLSKSVTVIKISEVSKEKDCGTDEKCIAGQFLAAKNSFFKNLATCTVSSVKTPINPYKLRFLYEIQSKVGNDCVFKISSTEIPKDSNEMTCKIPMNTKQDLFASKLFGDGKNITACSGSLIDYFKKLQSSQDFKGIIMVQLIGWSI